MKLELIQDWQAILKRAWSIKFTLLAGLCSGLEMVLPVVGVEMPRGIFAGIALLNSVMVVGARVLAQKEITDAGQGPK